MSSRTKQKILVTGFFYLLFIVLGTFGYLPSLFFRSENRPKSLNLFSDQLFARHISVCVCYICLGHRNIRRYC